MATDIYLKKMPSMMIPMDVEGEAYIASLKLGDVIRCRVSKPRNYKNLQRFMTLVRLLYDMWEPVAETWRGHIAEKNFTRFRHDLTILAGYYDTVIAINGDVRVEAKSLSFGSMPEEEFQRLFSKVIDVGLKRIPSAYTNEKEIQKAVDDILRYS